MPHQTVRELFASDIHRRIEEVIKVDQADEAIIKDELAEYVVNRATSSQHALAIPPPGEVHLTVAGNHEAEAEEPV